jgi:hypothetical protein
VRLVPPADRLSRDPLDARRERRVRGVLHVDEDRPGHDLDLAQLAPAAEQPARGQQERADRGERAVELDRPAHGRHVGLEGELRAQDGERQPDRRGVAPGQLGEQGLHEVGSGPGRVGAPQRPDERGETSARGGAAPARGAVEGAADLGRGGVAGRGGHRRASSGRAVAGTSCAQDSRA